MRIFTEFRIFIELLTASIKAVTYFFIVLTVMYIAFFTAIIYVQEDSHDKSKSQYIIQNIMTMY